MITFSRMRKVRSSIALDARDIASSTTYSNNRNKNRNKRGGERQQGKESDYTGVTKGEGK